jgi:quinol monooxygenase YgiN/quercetin dioxygenase-like cupin family protein
MAFAALGRVNADADGCTIRASSPGRNVMRWTLKAAKRLVLPALALSAIAGHALAEAGSDADPPAKTTGFDEQLLDEVNLGREIPGMEGRALRIRRITIAPGGASALHDHVDRPGTVYVLQGKVVDHRNGIATEYGPGLGWPEDRATTHWIENREKTPAEEISVDIVHRPATPAPASSAEADAGEITLVVPMTIRPEREAEFLAFARASIADVRRAEPGTLVYALKRNPDQPHSYVWIERYRDEAALREHERRLREARVIDKVRPFWASPPQGMRLEPVATE